MMIRSETSPTHDLVIANARLRNRPGVWCIGTSGPRITAITREELSGRRLIDADGGLVTESFVNGHMHLDKVYTLDRIDDSAITAYTAGTLDAARNSIDLASAVKAHYDRTWIEGNARRALVEAIRNGVRHVLAFADVDTKAELEGIVPLLRLRDALKGVVDLQVVAFPQDGVLRDPGAEELVAEGVRMGADVVGGIPWIEASSGDMEEHVRRMCALAQAHGRRVAMLVDDAADASLRTTQMLARSLLEHDLVGQGVANHARAVGLYDPPAVERLAGLAAQAGLGFVSDPHTGSVHLPVRMLTDLGVPVALGQDDIEDAYYPFGRHNMLEVAFLSSHALKATDTAGIALVYDAVTTTAARVLGIPHHRLEVGGNADLVVLASPTLREALAWHEAPRFVIASGRVVASSTTETDFADELSVLLD